MRHSVICFLFALLMTVPATASMPISSPWMADDTWKGGTPGSYYGQDYHTGVSHYAIDFNRYPGSTSDPGFPILAIKDGTVIFSGWRSGFGNCVEISHGTYNGKTTTSFYAHFEDDQPIAVKVGEIVKQGQVIGFCGMSGGTSTGEHLHFELREDGSSVEVSSMDNYHWCTSGCNGHVLTSLNHNIFDIEEAIQGSSIGSENGSVVWWTGSGTGWDAGDRYDENNNCARRCYKQAYTGGTYGNCAIIYDALGGARKAYTVRTGFWNNGQGNGWSQLSPAGPQSSLGMPITNEYANGSVARQDFQKGYLYYNGSTVSVNNYPNCAPGWTSSGWNNQYSYLFARAYERNGARSTVGEATGSVYSFGGFLRQNFSGGSLGDCCILYDPDNANQNADATNEAYLLHSGFYQYYVANGGAQAFGCPSRDEYATGDPGDAIQFFERRSPGDNPSHFMYFDASAQSIMFHSKYETDWVSQTPGSVTTMVQGSSQTFTVWFKNTGTTTWYNNPTSYPYDYICLKSTDPSGNAAASLLNNPFSGTLGWLDSQTPCTMQEASVAPGSTATFSFTGMVAPDRQLGLMDVYFRPNHSLAGLLDGWDGMHFQVNVVAAPTTPLNYMTGPAPAAEIAAMIASRKTTPLNNKNPYGFWQSPQQVSGGFNATYWWYDYGTTEAYMPDYTSRICYVSVATGQPGAVVHDVYGAARQSFYVGWWPWDNWAHMGWNCGACPNPAGTQAASQGGPYSCLGMPITNLYRPAPNEGYGRQDFQRGYIINGVIYCYDHITAFTPGWTASGWNQFWSYILTDCYDRYGAAAGLGHATQLVNENWDGTGYKIQPFDGGIYGPIMLVYNPNGPSEAYGVSGSFLYAYTMAIDGNSIRISSRIGSPTEDFSGNRQQFQSGYMTINYGTNETFVYLNDNTEIWNSQTGGHLGKLGQPTLPTVFALNQNYPNPFNPVTTVTYALPSMTHVTLEVYNVLGQWVVTLVDEVQNAGQYAVAFDGSKLASGIYLYRLHTDLAVETRKMIILK